MKKTLLVNPPNYSIKMLQEEISNVRNGTGDFTKSVDWGIYAPLGILYLAGQLREKGFDVEIYDLHRAFFLCRQNGYFKNQTLSNFFEDCFDKILKSRKIDLLGISCLFNVASSTVEEMGARSRNVSPFTKIVLGGHYPTNMYRSIIKSGHCDYIILGEAEEELTWLVNNLDDQLMDTKVNKNPHVVDYKCMDNPDKRPAMIGDLDCLAMPAWDLLPFANEYIENSMHAKRVGSKADKLPRSAGIMTTRGCPMKCMFCAAHSVHGRKVRAHSIVYIINHIDYLIEKYDINILLIEDDAFNFSVKRVLDFCEAIYRKYGGRFNIEFPNGLSVWLLNEEAIKHLKQIGLKTISVAVESGSSYVQRKILKKNLNLTVVKEKVELLKKYDIGVRAFYILGFVGENLKMMEETVNFAIELNASWSEIKIFTPLAGSEMYELARNKGYLVGDTSEHVYGRCCIRTPDFSPHQVEELRYDANIRINFLNNHYLKEKEFEIAEGIFRRLLVSIPDHLFAQWGLWKSLEGQEKNEESKEALKRLKVLSDKSVKNRQMLEKYKIYCFDRKQQSVMQKS